MYVCVHNDGKESAGLDVLGFRRQNKRRMEDNKRAINDSSELNGTQSRQIDGATVSEADFSKSVKNRQRVQEE